MAGETGKTSSRVLNKLQYDIANVASTITTAAGDYLLVADISDDYKVGKVALSSLTAASLGSLGESLIPTTDNSIDLGDATHEWKDLYVDGTAYVDAIDLNGTAVTSSAAELNILTGVTATATELNYLDLTTLGTGAASKAVVLDASADYTYPAAATIVYPSGATQTFSAGSTLNVAGTFQIGGVTLTATAALLDAAAAGTRAPIIIPDATPYTVLVANSGKTHIIAEQTANITINLPIIAAGLHYEFIMGGVATEAQNWIFVATTPSFLNGGAAWTDLNDAESNLAVVYGNGSSHLTHTVVTPAAGTKVCFYANTTPEWVVHSTVISDTTPTFT